MWNKRVKTTKQYLRNLTATAVLPTAIYYNNTKSYAKYKENMYTYWVLLLARLMGQHCFARWRLLFVVVCNAAGGRAGRPPGAWAVGRPTLHGGPVRLRPARATPCFNYDWHYSTNDSIKRAASEYQTRNAFTRCHIHLFGNIMCLRHSTVSAKPLRVRAVRLLRSSGQILLPRHLMNGFSNLDETYREYSIAPTDDLIRFSRYSSWVVQTSV